MRPEMDWLSYWDRVMYWTARYLDLEDDDPIINEFREVFLSGWEMGYEQCKEDNNLDD